MIRLNQLVTGYRGQPVSQPLNGCFPTASMTAVVGANGGGKSTLLRTLAGLLKPVSGTLQRPRQPLGWMPQHSALDNRFPLCTADVVAMGGWPAHGLWRSISHYQRAQVMSALAQVGLDDAASAPIGQLSGGQFQRMLFARLLMQNAPLMLLDEPFNGVDSASCARLLETMEGLQRTGTTLIVALHSLPLVLNHFSNTLVLGSQQYAWGPTDSLAGAGLLPGQAAQAPGAA